MSVQNGSSWWFLVNWNVRFLNKEILRMVAAAVCDINFLTHIQISVVRSIGSSFVFSKFRFLDIKIMTLRLYFVNEGKCYEVLIHCNQTVTNKIFVTVTIDSIINLNWVQTSK